MNLKTTEPDSIAPFLKNIFIPKPDSHKGQNGRVLVIGGSSLFHAASIWGAEIASHFVDIVHYFSTQENQEVFLEAKKKFRNGIVIPRDELESYIKEDDAVLIGPGMVRGKIQSSKFKVQSYPDILHIEDEPTFTYYLTEYLIEHFPNKKYVIDAGVLQMMKPEWLLPLEETPIVTPHQIEFERLFGISVKDKSLEQKKDIVLETAARYRCIILLKAVVDIISDGIKTYVVEGGNRGLTKGGTGDILAGLTLAMYAKNDPILSAVISSYILKASADDLYVSYGYWYNIANLIDRIPQTLDKYKANIMEG